MPHLPRPNIFDHTKGSMDNGVSLFRLYQQKLSKFQNNRVRAAPVCHCVPRYKNEERGAQWDEMKRIIQLWRQRKRTTIRIVMPLHGMTQIHPRRLIYNNKRNTYRNKGGQEKTISNVKTTQQRKQHVDYNATEKYKYNTATQSIISSA